MAIEQSDNLMPATYLHCPPLDGDRVGTMRATLQEWVRSPILLKLVQSFGGSIPSGLDLASHVSWLLDFSRRWDFRNIQQSALANDIGEGARWLVNAASLSRTQLESTDRASRQLGLIGVEKPTRFSFNYTVVLGGARLSCLLRPKLAALLVKDGDVKTESIVLLASSRPVSASERDATDTYAKEARDEFDLISAGAEISFGLPKNDFLEERSPDFENPNEKWVVRRYHRDNDFPKIVSFSAPSSEPEKRRANSADTFKFFLSQEHVPEGSSFLMLTSQIYVPYQQLEAIRTLAIPHHLWVETIGFPMEWAGKMQGMTEPTNYLQEIRSTIQSADRFLKAFPIPFEGRGGH